MDVLVSSSCSPDSIYFINTILPLIASSCAMAGCHDAAAHREGIKLIDYAGIMKTVRAGNPGKSELFQAITSSERDDLMPPPPRQKLSAQSITAIQNWIIQGARNNQCITQCDTSVFTYSGAVLPIINTYCKGCHNPSSPGGGIDLTTYTNVRMVALNGKLSGSINHSSGFVPMPPGSVNLDECEVKQIEKWIQAGTPNN